MAIINGRYVNLDRFHEREYSGKKVIAEDWRGEDIYERDIEQYYETDYRGEYVHEDDIVEWFKEAFHRATWEDF